MAASRRSSCVVAVTALVVLLAFGVVLPAGAQEAPLTTPTELTPDALSARITRIKDAPDLEEARREKLLELYQQALARINEAQQSAAEARNYEVVQREAPERLAEIRAQLATEPARPEVDPSEVPADQTQRYLAEAEADLAAAKERVGELEADQKRRSERRVEVPKLAAAAREELQQVEQALAAQPAEPETPLQAAEKTLLRARKEALEQSLKAYERELLSYEARGELLTARHDLAARELARAEKAAARWQEAAQEKRRQEAEEALREAARQAARAHPALREVAERNKELAELRAQTLTPRLDQAAERLRSLEGELAELKRDLQNVQKRVQKAPQLTEALGLLLRKKRTELPDIGQHRRNIQQRQPEIGQAELKLAELEERRAELADLEAAVEELAGQLEDASPRERKQIASAARELLQTRLELLRDVYHDYDRYFDVLVELDARERELILTAEDYGAFIEEHFLWFPSSQPLGIADVRRLGPALRGLLSPDRWAAVLKALLSDLRRRGPLYGLALLAFGGLLVLKPRLKRRLQRAGELASAPAGGGISRTLESLLYTALLCAAWPVLLGSLGLLLASAAGAPDFARSAGMGLQATALALVTFGFLRKLCMEEGLADVHFRWRTRALEVFRNNLAWLTYVIVPVAFVVVTLEGEGLEADRGSLGRIAFIVGLFAFSIFTLRILRRRGGVLQEFLARKEGGWLDRLRPVWYTLAAAAPLALAVAAGAGYYYTALVLSRRLAVTVWLVAGLLVVYELMLRWLFLAQRRLAVEQARKRREAAEAEEEQPEGGEAPPPAEEPEMTIHAISTQSRQLLRSVLWFALFVVLWLVWSDVVPALGVLDEVVLEKDLPITLAGVGLALLIFVVTLVAAKNVPGLLEMAALQYLPLDAAVRFAIARVCRYTITVIGVILAFGAIGVGWEQVQWLAAAITVGLGFGLQEIFANFVSGLIILFERPMRVGDVVTVGDVTGTVSKIRIRATTITDWDRKELIVPNREFITGRLINWTLSDRILRVIIPVGIAYGSDTERARETLLRVARENEKVLDEPEPTVLFVGFGDSSLNFELRVFVPSVEVRLQARDELHTAVDQAFREAGIEISFPQRDLHVRSIRAALPLEERPPGGRPEA